VSDEEIKQLLLEWADAKGGTFTEEELESLTAVLEEHFDSPRTATFEEVRRVIGLA
jgi:hypothetical protein